MLVGQVSRLVLLAGFLLLGLVANSVPAGAQMGRGSGAGGGPKTLLLLASGLCFDDLRAGGPLPHVRELAEAGGVALLNTAVSGEPTEAAAYLSVGGGERLAAPAARLVALAGAAKAGEGGKPVPADLARQVVATETGRAIYRRRFGAWPPSHARFVHLGLPALLGVQATPGRAAQVGALGEALARAGQRHNVLLGDALAALVLVDRRGVVAEATGNAGQNVAALLGTAQVVAVAADSPAALDRLCAGALPLARAGRANVFVAVPAPPRDPDGKRWARLGFVAVAGPNVAPRTLLTSPTTRTPGLVANIDIAPTVLAWQNVSAAPGTAFAGRVITGAPLLNPWAAVARLDRQVVATKNATVPVLIGYGVFAIGTGLVALFGLLSGRTRVVRASRWGLLTAAGALVAFLPVGVWAPRSPMVYGTAVAVVSVMLAAGATLFARRAKAEPLGVLLVFAAAAIIADAFAGSPFVSRALLSGYFLPGIRFYGVGNEYMGLVIGAGGGLRPLAPDPARHRPAVFRQQCGRSNYGGRHVHGRLFRAARAPAAGATHCRGRRGCPVHGCGHRPARPRPAANGANAHWVGCGGRASARAGRPSGDRHTQTGNERGPFRNAGRAWGAWRPCADVVAAGAPRAARKPHAARARAPARVRPHTSRGRLGGACCVFVQRFGHRGRAAAACAANGNGDRCCAVRLLGVDYGTKRIGLAVSDELGWGAYPLATLQRSRRLGHDLDQIARHAEREQVGKIVIGLPVNADGSHGPAAEAATQFARALAKHTPLPIVQFDEFLTTAEAQEDLLAADVSRKRRRAVIDQVAAAKILEGFLREEKEQARRQERVAEPSLPSGSKGNEAD